MIYPIVAILYLHATNFVQYFGKKKKMYMYPLCLCVSLSFVFFPASLKNFCPPFFHSRNIKNQRAVVDHTILADQIPLTEITGAVVMKNSYRSIRTSVCLIGYRETLRGNNDAAFSVWLWSPIESGNFVLLFTCATMSLSPPFF